MEKHLKIALAQTTICWEAQEENYKIAEKWIHDAAMQGAGAIFFPEMSFTGFSMNTSVTKERDGRTIARMKALARQYHIHIGFGWVKDCTAECGKCENHYTIVDRDGSVCSDYAKIHPFSYSGEDEKFQGGSAVSCFALDDMMFGSAICYDLRFPELFQVLSKRASVILVAANWPAKRSAHWKALLQARAIENQVYILAVNCAGSIGGVWYTGDSCVIDPDGIVRACLSGSEGMIYYELTDDTASYRTAFPVKQDRREALYARLAAMVLAAALTLTGCGQYASQFTALLTNQSNNSSTTQTEADIETETVVDEMNRSGIYDSEDAAVVVRKDLEAKTVQFQNIASSRRYTLTYDGTTTIYDKNEQALSMEQLKEGSVVTVRFYKPRKALAYIKENPDCISYHNVSGYSMDLSKGTIALGKELYNISSHVVVVSDGRETDMMEVSQMDELSVWGYKNMIYGIHVEKGHGYLRLQNQDYFVNGWIDVGDSVIRKITEDMLLVVPEGTHTVTVSHKGSSATQEITFARNEEMAWDLGEVEITVVQKGTVIFTLNPVTAKVSIDGREVNVSKPVEIEYGLHQMRITADGYDTVAQYIRVGEPSANIAVELEKSEESSTEKTSEKASDKNSDKNSDKEKEDEDDDQTTSKKYQSKSSEPEDDEDEKEEEEREEEKKSTEHYLSSSEKYKVYIDAPDGVEAYLDGSYVGVTPVSFNKEPGSHVVTLRKSGYQTRSYTLQIDEEEKDVNYSFTDLIQLEDS